MRVKVKKRSRPKKIGKNCVFMGLREKYLGIGKVHNRTTRRRLAKNAGRGKRWCRRRRGRIRRNIIN